MENTLKAKPSWSDIIEAKDACHAVFLYWQKCLQKSSWEECNYEMVYCENTRETVYIRTIYLHKDGRHLFFMLDKKPEEPVKRTDETGSNNQKS